MTDHRITVILYYWFSPLYPLYLAALAVPHKAYVYHRVGRVSLKDLSTVTSSTSQSEKGSLSELTQTKFKVIHSSSSVCCRRSCCPLRRLLSLDWLVTVLVRLSPLADLVIESDLQICQTYRIL